jgi:prepilin-type N-terminal cleavage/methylation domain-containing protein
MVNKNDGFSLIEMAIVLIIIGLLATGLLGPLAISLEHNKIKSTEKTLESVQESLYGFAIINERLPCADTDNDGIEDCPAITGDLPWVNLGVGRYDGWGNSFKYAVDTRYTIDIQLSDFPPSIEIKQYHNENTDPPNEKLLVPCVIWSEGRNDWDSNLNEAENENGNEIFVIGQYIEGQYDDIVISISWNAIMHRLLLSKKLGASILKRRTKYLWG